MNRKELKEIIKENKNYIDQQFKKVYFKNKNKYNQYKIKVSGQKETFYMDIDLKQLKKIKKVLKNKYKRW